MSNYNGWTNYETWNLNLWITNDQGSDEYWREIAAEIVADELQEDKDAETAREDAANRIADLLREFVDEEEERIFGEVTSGFMTDILRAALSDINYYEIAAHFAEDVPIYFASISFPGCLPESSAFFNSIDDANEWLAEMLADLEPEDGESEQWELWDNAHDIGLSTMEDRVQFAGMNYESSEL